MNNQTLVSIVVITYNSSKYIIETLESAKNQSYQKVELIISDDCSTDNTVEICKEWICKNKERFVDVQLLISPVNTGIAPNCNRGCRAAKGEWIKMIAGDDALLDTCIENFVEHINYNPQSVLIQSRILFYRDTLQNEDFLGESEILNPVFRIEGYSAKDQFDLLSFGCSILAPGVIIKNEILKAAGYFDETIRMCEDWPMWLKVTSLGYKIDFLDKSTAKYRLNQDSIYYGSSRNRIVTPFYMINHEIYKKYIQKESSCFRNIMQVYLYGINRLFSVAAFSGRFSLLSIMYKILYKLYYFYQRRALKIIENRIK